MRALSSTQTVRLIDNAWNAGDCRIADCGTITAATGNSAADDAVRDAILAEVFQQFPYHQQDNDGNGFANGEEAVLYGTDPIDPSSKPTGAVPD